MYMRYYATFRNYSSPKESGAIVFDHAINSDIVYGSISIFNFGNPLFVEPIIFFIKNLGKYSLTLLSIAVSFIL